ncbi:hypothetical protein L208DRAFT_1450495 [Tricholoma matsutake]|nr:hypothetical protein L208DRAFT_1450495 [Tricholoma matsutake 945]
MSNTNPRLYSYSYDTLLNQLNVLLRALQLPILLQSPTDLTPSLLIAIMESLLSKRIPLEFSPSRNRSKTNVHSMKIFLGVLESDILKMDVGLSTVDPRRLANGEWEELGLMESCDEDDELQYAVEKHEGSIARIDRPYSPSTSAMSVTTKQTNTVSNFSLHRHTSNTSMSFSDTPQNSSPPVQSSRTRSSPLGPSQLSPPRCIHEVPSPSIVLTPDKPAVRYTGYIEPVDEELELRSFESSQSMYNQKSSMFFDDHIDHQIDHVQLKQSRARTITLLNERARLLEELAKVSS